MRETKSLSIELETVTKHMKRPLDVKLLDQCVDEQTFQARPVQCPHLLPELPLRFLKKSEDARGKQRALHVPFRIGASLPGSLGEQDFLNIALEGFFGGLAH